MNAKTDVTRSQIHGDLDLLQREKFLTQEICETLRIPLESAFCIINIPSFKILDSHVTKLRSQRLGVINCMKNLAYSKLLRIFIVTVNWHLKNLQSMINSEKLPWLRVENLLQYLLNGSVWLLLPPSLQTHEVFCSHVTQKPIPWKPFRLKIFSPLNKMEHPCICDVITFPLASTIKASANQMLCCLTILTV